MNYAKIIYQLRDVRMNEKQSAFASNIGISQTHLSKIESGHITPSIGVLKNISDHVKIPLPVLQCMCISESDIEESKIEGFRVLKPVLDQILQSIF